MTTKFKSVTRALKRKNLRVSMKKVPAPIKADPVTGIMSSGVEEIPFLERRTHRGWISYNF